MERKKQKGKSMGDEKNSRDRGKKKDRQKPDRETEKDLKNILGQLRESNRGGEKKIQTDRGGKGDFSFQPPQKQSGTESEPEGLDTILEKISEKEAEEPVEDQNALERIINVFVNPLKLFQYLRQKPEFVLPLVLAILLGLGTAPLIYDIAIVVILFFLISAVFMFIGNVLLGGRAKYKQVLSVYGYSYLIMAILGTIVKVPLILKQQTVKIDTSLAVLFSPESMSTALYNFIGSFDIFTVWFLIVFGIGFAVIYRFSKLKALTSVFTAWLAYVVIFKVLLGSLFSGFGA
jgi:hypothetical protein